MTLIFDRSGELAGKDVTHAFVVAVSDYQHLAPRSAPTDPNLYDMRKLDAPGRSAAKIVEWLSQNMDKLEKPLATIELIASPAAAEVDDINAVLAVVAPGIAAVDRARLNEFSATCGAWRQRAAVRRDNAAFFYFAGHGLERPGSQLLPLEDFGDPGFGRFHCAVMLQNIYDGMAPSDDCPDIARTQFYFVDACRTRVTDFAGLTTTATDIFSSVPKIDDRAAPIFYASYPGDVALAQEGGLTRYAEILLKAFEIAVTHKRPGDNRWPIDSMSLLDAISIGVRRAKLARGVSGGGNSFGKAVLHWLDNPPIIDFDVAVSPDAAINTTNVELKHANGGPKRVIAAAPGDHPYRTSLPTGYYLIKADAGRPDFKPLNDAVFVDYKIETCPIHLESLP